MYFFSRRTPNLATVLSYFILHYPISRPFRSVLCLLVLIACAGGALAATPKRKPAKSSARSSASKKIEKQRLSSEQQLTKLRSEIRQYQQQLADHERKEKKKISSISAYNKRTQELKAVITRLQGEVAELSQEKHEVDVSLQQTSNSLENLKRSYTASTQFLYKQKDLHRPKLDPALASNQRAADADRFAYYGKLLSAAHSENHSKLDSAKQSLSEDKAEISETLSEERSMVLQRAGEQAAVERQREQEARELAQIQANKEKVKRELQRRLESAKKLEGMIASLITREEAAKSAERSQRNKTGAKSNSKSSKSNAHFADDEIDSRNTAFHTHALMWPTSSHRIKQAFGEHRNKELNTVTMNLGIDIDAPQGSSVVSVAEGEVSLVSSLPSYGTIVVLRHAGGFHTVYADLQSVSISRGAKVRAGQLIGRSGTNTELGSLLHFEIWKGKAKQNPTAWLR